MRPNVLLFLVDEDNGGVFVYEQVVIRNPLSRLIGIDVPHIVFKQQLTNINCAKGESAIVVNEVMKEFVGLEEESPLVMAAVIDFSFYLRVGNADKAFEAIKMTKSSNVWRYLGLLIGNAGLIMDTFAMKYPSHFLLIASVASLCNIILKKSNFLRLLQVLLHVLDFLIISLIMVI